MADLPVACTLSPAALKARKANLLNVLLHRVDERRELPDGYRLRFAAEGEILSAIARTVDAERQCCRFLRFTIPAYADVVTDWNTAALNAIRIDRTPPPRASRALAILHTSIYDAVNGISRTSETYFVRSGVPASASKEAAASAAAHKVLISLFPASCSELRLSARCHSRRHPEWPAEDHWYRLGSQAITPPPRFAA